MNTEYIFIFTLQIEGAHSPL